MKCPYCNTTKTRVIDTTHESGGGIRRRRECKTCDKRFSTLERAILTTPIVVKSDGRREPFDRSKLLSGIRVACAKRPISSAAIEGLVNSIEGHIQQSSKAEISSKMIGDMVIAELKELDHIAYIRFATVYLRLRDIEAVQNEIEKILGQ